MASRAMKDLRMGGGGGIKPAPTGFARAIARTAGPLMQRAAGQAVAAPAVAPAPAVRQTSVLNRPAPVAAPGAGGGIRPAPSGWAGGLARRMGSVVQQVAAAQPQPPQPLPSPYSRGLRGKRGGRIF